MINNNIIIANIFIYYDQEMREIEKDFLSFKANRVKKDVDNTRLVSKVESIIYLIFFGWEKGFLKLKESTYNETLLGILTDLCHNLVGIKGCIKEGSPVGVNVLMRRILEIALNLNILFSEEGNILKKLTIYDDFIKVKHHDSFKSSPSLIVSNVMRKYEKEAKNKYKHGMKERKREYRSAKGYLVWYFSIEGETSIEALLKKYKLSKLQDILLHMAEEGAEVKTIVDGIDRPDIDKLDLYAHYSGNVHPSSVSNSNIKPEEKNSSTLLGYTDTTQFENDMLICGLLAYVSIKPILLYCSPEKSSDYKRLFMITMLRQ